MKNNFATLYIVRHGESAYNALPKEDQYIPGIFGPGGAPLTETGKEQAAKRAEDLRHIHFDAIFSSDVSRTTQTAEILKLERELAIQTTKVIRERLSYKLPKKTFSESIKEVKKILKKLDKEAQLAYKPQGQEEMSNENSNETAARVLTFLREVAIGYINKTVLIVNHANNMRAILQHLGYATIEELYPEEAIENLAYIILESDGVDFFVKETKGIQTRKKGSTEV
jgi:broad specificity phosphatase PhoE